MRCVRFSPDPPLRRSPRAESVRGRWFEVDCLLAPSRTSLEATASSADHLLGEGARPPSRPRRLGDLFSGARSHRHDWGARPSVLSREDLQVIANGLPSIPKGSKQRIVVHGARSCFCHHALANELGWLRLGPREAGEHRESAALEIRPQGPELRGRRDGRPAMQWRPDRPLNSRSLRHPLDLSLVAESPWLVKCQLTMGFRSRPGPRACAKGPVPVESA